MKVSYNWLASYFHEGEAPAASQVSDLLNFHSFEVESAEQMPHGDTLFDVKVLPNRAHDALSHWSIAWELASITGKKLDTGIFANKIESFSDSRSLEMVELRVEDSVLVPRALKRVVEKVSVGPSPAWLVERLASIGQRSINNIVDATNYLTHELGQPVHAFDYDKLAGSGRKLVQIRRATPGEPVTTLDGKTFELEPWMLVIADSEKALDIAGIKGGNNSGIDEGTTRVLLSACTFDGTTIRKTSQKLCLRTDASIRFEHTLSPHLAEVGINRLTSLVLELAGGAATKDIVDIYPNPQVTREIKITAEDIRRVLGITMSAEEIEGVLNRIGFSWKPGYVVEVPPTRLDLVNTPDMIEEIGRMHGYEHVVPVLPAYAEEKRPAPLKSYFYAEKIRGILAEKGFSELYLYSLGEKGEREVENPMAENKNMMRVELASGISERLAFNIKNKDVLGLEQVSLFEIGNVYPRAGERTHCVMASSDKKMNLQALLPWPVSNTYKGKENILEFNLTELLESLPAPKSYSELSPVQSREVVYSAFSPYPFIARDVAVFVPVGTSESEVSNVIGAHKGSLCVLGPRLFDTFTKTFPDGSQKVSYGFRLVFQSPVRTLTNEEVQVVMDGIYAKLGQHSGWQVR